MVSGIQQVFSSEHSDDICSVIATDGESPCGNPMFYSKLLPFSRQHHHQKTRLTFPATFLVIIRNVQ